MRDTTLSGITEDDKATTGATSTQKAAAVIDLVDDESTSEENHESVGGSCGSSDCSTEEDEDAVSLDSAVHSNQGAASDADSSYEDATGLGLTQECFF